jgi:hypothetical protein
MKITTILLATALTIGATTAIGQEQMLPAPVQETTPSVSDKELEKFANIYLEVQAESQKMQEEAVEIIQTEGMELERFNEISKAKNDPNKDIQKSGKEEEQIASISVKIQEIQTEFQALITEKIQIEGLTIQRYQEVYAAVQQDQELQQKLGQMINS